MAGVRINLAKNFRNEEYAVKNYVDEIAGKTYFPAGVTSIIGLDGKLSDGLVPDFSGDFSGKVSTVITAVENNFALFNDKGHIKDSLYSIGVTVANGFGGDNKIATENGVKAYVDNADNGKISVVTGKADYIPKFNASGHVESTDYKIGVTVANGFGVTEGSWVATEAGTKAFVDALVGTANLPTGVTALVGSGKKIDSNLLPDYTTTFAGKINTVVDATADTMPTFTTGGHLAKTNYKIGVVIKDNYGADNLLATEKGTKAYVDNVASGKISDVTTPTENAVPKLTSTGKLVTTDYLIGVTVLTGFGTNNRLATELGAKAYTDDVANGKIGTVPGAENYIPKFNSSGHIESTAYKIGVTVASGFGTANNLATELGAKAYTDSLSFSGLLTKEVASNANYKIPDGVIPDLAITQVYTANATASTVSGNSTTDAATLLALIKDAVSAAGVQRGDVVIVTSTSVAQAEAYAGSYIFTTDVANKNNIVAANFVKMYVPTGTIVTVNGKAGTNGAVTVNWKDIGNSSSNGTVDNLEVDNDNKVKITKVGGSAIELAKDTDLTNTSTSLSNAKTVLQAAVQKAVELVESEITLANGKVGGSTVPGISSAISSGVVTMTVPGRAMCIYDGGGNMIYPSINYTSGVSTLTADYGAVTPPDTTWIVTYTKAITVAYS